MWQHGRFSHRFVSAITLLTFSAGCTTWKSPELTPEQILVEKRPNHVRVIRADGAQLELWIPRITNDSLIGRLQPTGSVQLGGVPLADIKQLQVREVSGGKTALVMAGVGITVLLVAAIAAANTDLFEWKGSGGSQSSCPVVYAWDGRHWRLDSGTFGGAIMPALARTDVDNLLHVVAVADTVRLRVANELRETDHLDHIAVVAVDHRPGSAVVPDGGGRLQSPEPRRSRLT